MFSFSYDNLDDCLSDLAVERQRARCDIRGISYERVRCPIGYWERVRVSSDEGASAIGRPIGTYDTLSTERLDTEDEDSLYDIQEELARRLCVIFDDISVMPARILVVGLGNPTLTPDSLGPRTAERIKATMHIREYDEELFDALECSEIAIISPGVSAHTGLDTGVIIKAMCEAISPDVVIAVDSLMTRSEERLGRTIQISDSGIFPGGLGNLKTPITRSGVGVPVIGIGVPTVISSRLLTNDLGEKPILTEPHLLVPKNIDEITRVGARVISGAINQAFGLDA